VEVLANLVDNPSLETGSGDPWIPTGFSNGTEGDPFDSGDTQIETSILHSGISSIRYNAGATSSEWILNTYLGGVGDGYYDRGGYLYGNGTNSPSIQAHYSNREVGQSTGLAQNLGVTTSGWQHKAGVVRHPSGHMHSIRLNGSGQGSVYADDLYTYRLTDVSLTVNPANQANSTEASGLRVDGADTLTQPITGLSATSGVIRYKWTPRYGISIANKFGFPDNSFHRLMIAFGDGSNYVLMNRNTSTQIQAIAYFNGALVTATVRDLYTLPPVEMHGYLVGKTLVSFRLSPPDASLLLPYFESFDDEIKLDALPDFEIIARIRTDHGVVCAKSTKGSNA
jgi:hypothetical protein